MNPSPPGAGSSRSQLSVRSSLRVKSTRHWATNGIVHSSGMIFFLSSGPTSIEYHIPGPSSTETQILRPFWPNAISEPVMDRSWSLPARVTRTS